VQLHLSNTTHTLELITSVTDSIMYEISYADVDLTTSSINSTQGLISLATTTTILSAPIAATIRKVQMLNIYNNGISTNTLKIQKSISGVKTILQNITLQTGENIRVVNDTIYVYDISGRPKTQNTGDSEITGTVQNIYKIGTAPKAAGQFYSFSKDSGFPGAWSTGVPGINGRNTDGTLIADAGCINLANPTTGSWYLRDINISATQTGQYLLRDYLWVNTGLVVTTLTAQAITQPILPPRDSNGTINGTGVQVGILVTTATTNVANITNITLSYTNNLGVAGRVATMSVFPLTANIGTFVKFQLQAGDLGVKSIQSITLGTSLITGSISLVCFTEIASSSVLLANVGSLAYPKKLDLKLYNGHCLISDWLASNTTALNISGNIYFINK
jgi:hypothetical protein